MRLSPLWAVPALVEVLAAIALGWLVRWCWQHGVIVTVRDGVELSHIDGRWWTAALAGATLAGILLLDAGRRVAPRFSERVRCSFLQGGRRGLERIGE